jgi:hypothetical protein
VVARHVIQIVQRRLFFVLPLLALSPAGMAYADEVGSAGWPGSCSGVPDAAAVNQYCERLISPDGTGIDTSTKTEQSWAVSLVDVLPVKVAKRLRRMRGDGRRPALERMVQRLPAPVRLPADPSGGGSSAGAVSRRIARERIKRVDARVPGARAVSATVHSLERSALSGPFRWAVLISTIGMFGAAWTRLRQKE